eukprot:6192061-Pleurochrysis_carterae.AAC.2
MKIKEGSGNRHARIGCDHALITDNVAYQVSRAGFTSSGVGDLCVESRDTCGKLVILVVPQGVVSP